MTDSLTTSTRFTQPTVGGDSGTWGTLLNSNWSYVDIMVNQIISVSVPDINVTLVADGSSGDQARYGVYFFTGALTADRTITLPAVPKLGQAANFTTGGHNIILSTGSGPTLALTPDGSWFRYGSGSGSNGVAELPIHINTDGPITTSSNISSNGGSGFVTLGNTGFITYQPAAPTVGFTWCIFNSGGANVGSISFTGGGASFNTASDETLKIIDGPITNSGPLVDALEPIWFRWNADPNASVQPGFGAQTTYRVIPSAVMPGDAERPWVMDQAKLMSIAVAEIKSLRARMAAAEDRIAELEDV